MTMASKFLHSVQIQFKRKMSESAEKSALLEGLRSRDLRSGSNPSKFSQAEGRKLIKDFLFKIMASDVSKEAFDDELSFALLLFVPALKF
jgi:hypothetical protein